MKSRMDELKRQWHVINFARLEYCNILLFVFGQFNELFSPFVSSRPNKFHLIDFQFTAGDNELEEEEDESSSRYAMKR